MVPKKYSPRCLGINTFTSRPGPLTGQTVLVTRPAHQAEVLAQQIEAAGGKALRFPVLAVEPVTISAPDLSLIKELDQYDWAIFISVNAVDFGLLAVRDICDWPDKVKIAVIGKSSAAAVEQAGLFVDACPAEQFSSEGLLALIEMQQVAGQKIIIFRGVGGRDLLADSLRNRGATVDVFSSYCRVKPDSDPEIIRLSGRYKNINSIQINSIESLENLCEMIGNDQSEWLYNTPLVVVSPRIVDRARTLGFKNTIRVADSAMNDAVMQALIIRQPPN